MPSSAWSTLLLPGNVEFLRVFVILQKKRVAPPFNAFRFSFYTLPSHIRNKSPFSHLSVRPNEGVGIACIQAQGRYWHDGKVLRAVVVVVTQLYKSIKKIGWFTYMVFMYEYCIPQENLKSTWFSG